MTGSGWYAVVLYCALAYIFNIDDDIARWVGEMVREAVNAYNA